MCWQEDSGDPKIEKMRGRQLWMFLKVIAILNPSCLQFLLGSLVHSKFNWFALGSSMEQRNWLILTRFNVALIYYDVSATFFWEMSIHFTFIAVVNMKCVELSKKNSYNIIALVSKWVKMSNNEWIWNQNNKKISTYL